ncbi:TPA: hypothetical protein N0F65_006714 [Lagenidium giganteum]|uniref:Ubiquitin-like protease family profile domain-containing protein n=1 Tax=Lagenidium giganteum TaxID=4803 RepID=A0AAV2Z6P3_9STRA|nr:TPA: hypothetical protein N0F65_006714 [Lagenidium giganteum]
MRRLFSRCSELILVDCTHNTNRYHYQLFTVMVMDEFGHGQVVHHSVMETNSAWHMTRAMQHYVRTHGDHAKKVQVVMADKDLNENNVIQRALPGVSVCICLFHVLKYLKAAVRDPKYGKLSADDQEPFNHIIPTMVYAKDEASYEGHQKSLKNMCKRLTHKHLQNLATDTNNVLENFFGKIKKEVSAVTDMRTLFQTVWNRALRDKHEYVQEVRKTGQGLRSGDERSTQVDHRFVAGKIAGEYASAVNDLQFFKTPATPRVYRVSGDVEPLAPFTYNGYRDQKARENQEQDDEDPWLPDHESAAGAQSNKVDSNVKVKVEDNKPQTPTRRLPVRASTAEEDSEPRINLNHRAKKTGRPKLDRKKEAAATKKKRAEFMAGLKIRRKEGAVTLVQFAQAIAKDKPGLKECCERVGGLPVRFTKFANREPKLVTKKACVVKLLVSETSAESPIVVSQSSNPSTPGSDCDGEVHCVSIASKRCKEGSDTVRWQQEVVACAVDADKHEEVNRVAEWINAHNTVAWYGKTVVIDVLRNTRGSTLVVEKKLLGKITAFKRQFDADIKKNAPPRIQKLLIPVNVPSHHWGIMIDMPKRTYYDRLDSETIVPALENICKQLRKTTFEMSHIDAEVTPKQTDSFNCGVFVCKFCKFVDPDFSFSCTKKSLAQMRYEVLHFILYGEVEGLTPAIQQSNA